MMTLVNDPCVISGETPEVVKWLACVPTGQSGCETSDSHIKLKTKKVI